MILAHPFVSQKSVDELVATLLMFAEQRESYYAPIQIVRAARTGIDEPIIHPRASVTRIAGGITEVTFFRDDAPDDETPGTVNRWQYLDENGEPVEGKVIEVTLRPTHRGTNVTFTCYAEEYQTEFGRLLDDFGVPLPEPTERDQETQVDAPTGETPSEDAGKEMQAAAPTGNAPSEDTKRAKSNPLDLKGHTLAFAELLALGETYLGAGSKLNLRPSTVTGYGKEISLRVRERTNRGPLKAGELSKILRDLGYGTPHIGG